MNEHEDFIRKYLNAVEQRDLKAAGSYLAPEVVITFPGGRTFHTLDTQIASSATRFEAVAKLIEHVDVIDGDEVVVYVFGTLQGVALSGNPFEGVRFIDRFLLTEGRITEQQVWNDLAESGVVDRR